MMHVLREKMKLVMLITLGAFLATIIFSWGAGGFKNRGMLEQGIVGEINGRKIKYQDFEQMLSQQLQNYRQQAPDQEIPEYQMQGIRDQVWNGIVMDILQGEAIESMHLQATPEEIFFRLKNDPPVYLRQVEQFQTDGQFDMAKYQQALSTPGNADYWLYVENVLRQEIQQNKLRQHIIASTHVSDEEVREAYQLENERVKARLLFFDPNAQSLENILVTDSDIDSYYKDHQEDYRLPEQRQIDYVQFTVKPSVEDSAQVLEDVKYIMEQLEDGESFDELAMEFSKDTGSREKGGDLGFFKKDEMEAPFTEAAFSTRPGKVVGPVKTQLGIHIIKVLGKKREDGEQKVHAQHILLKYEISSETRDAIVDKAQYIYDEMDKNAEADFATLASEEGATLQTSPLFRKGGFLPGIGMAYRLVNRAFQKNIGEMSQPVYAGDNLVVFRMKAIEKSHIQPLEDVKATIQRVLQTERKKEKAASQCEAVSARITGGMTLEMAAAEDSLQVIEADFFNIQGAIPQIGREPLVNGTAFALQVGAVSAPLHAERGSYLIQVVDKQAMDEAAFTTELATRRDQLLRQKQSSAWMAWLNQLREKASIKDQREYYY